MLNALVTTLPKGTRSDFEGSLLGCINGKNTILQCILHNSTKSVRSCIVNSGVTGCDAHGAHPKAENSQKGWSQTYIPKPLPARLPEPLLGYRIPQGMSLKRRKRISSSSTCARKKRMDACSRTRGFLRGLRMRAGMLGPPQRRASTGSRGRRPRSRLENCQNSVERSDPSKIRFLQVESLVDIHYQSCLDQLL